MDRKLVPLERTVTGISFYGERGSGKTLAMTTLAYLEYLDGTKIYANYGLNFPHIKITDTNFHSNIEVDGKRKFIALDDMLHGHKQSIHETELNRVLTLARKLIAQDEKTTIAFSTPLLDQYSYTIKQFTDFYIEPKTWKWSDQPEPCLLRLKWYTKDPSRNKGLIPAMITKFNLTRLGICNLYDTKEAPKPIVSGIYKDIWDKLGKYAYSTKRGIISYLTEKIADDWGLSHNRAKHYARSVLSGYNPNSDQEEKEKPPDGWGGLRSDL